MSCLLMNTDKQVMRDHMLEQLRRMSPGERAQESLRICRLIEEQDWFRSAQMMGAYLPLSREVDIMPLVEGMMASGKFVYLPCRRAHQACYAWSRYAVELEPGPDGVDQPVADDPPATDALDLVLVPGLAFDTCGMRLGRGGGYFDRLLADTRTMKVGVAFSCQMVDRVAAVEHDVPMDAVVTPEQIFNVNRTMNIKQKTSGRN